MIPLFIGCGLRSGCGWAFVRPRVLGRQARFERADLELRGFGRSIAVWPGFARWPLARPGSAIPYIAHGWSCPAVVLMTDVRWMRRAVKSGYLNVFTDLYVSFTAHQVVVLL